MSFLNKFKCLIALVLITLTTSVAAVPLLNGIGSHQELGQDVFIGALYSDPLNSNADELLKSTQPMRMELKITAPEGLSTRRFSRMWIEGMAINNKPDILTAQADNMVKFDSLFKGKFLTNDKIVFSSTPGKGVDISTNGVLLGNIADNQFFPMLLSAWIGRVPLSSDFRDSMLKSGNINGALKARYDAISVPESRVAEIRAWVAKPAAVEVAAKPVEKTPVKVAVAEKPTPKPETTSVASTKPEIPKLGLPAIEKPKLDIPPIAAAPVANKKEVKKPEPAKVAAADEEDEENAPALTAQSLLARQFYVSDILKKVFTKTRYPSRALERGQEGSVRYGVTVDREGNILSMTPLEESAYDALNKEASAAIKRAAPFPAMPDALPGSKFELTIPIRFVLPKQK